jgi:hypothetical protein
MTAIYSDTPPDATSPWVMPGTYTVKLTFNGKTYEQSLTIKTDPRVGTAVEQLQLQHDLSMICYENRKRLISIQSELEVLRTRIDAELKTDQNRASLRKLEQNISRLEGNSADSKFGVKIMRDVFAVLFNILQESDMAPTSQTILALKEAQTKAAQTLKEWEALKADAESLFKK